jgi:hypothetical protein
MRRIWGETLFKKAALPFACLVWSPSEPDMAGGGCRASSSGSAGSACPPAPAAAPVGARSTHVWNTSNAYAHAGLPSNEACDAGSDASRDASQPSVPVPLRETA